VGVAISSRDAPRSRIGRALHVAGRHRSGKAKTFRPYGASLLTRTEDPVNDAQLELFAPRFRSSADGRDAASDGR
jgi:hypothetical protein